MRSLSPVIPEESLGGRPNVPGARLTVRPNPGMTETRDHARWYRACSLVSALMERGSRRHSRAACTLLGSLVGTSGFDRAAVREGGTTRAAVTAPGVVGGWVWDVQTGRRRATGDPATRDRGVACGVSIGCSFELGYRWSGRRDSNPRPLEPHSSALPGCATSRPLISARA